MFTATTPTEISASEVRPIAISATAIQSPVTVMLA